MRKLPSHQLIITFIFLLSTCFQLNYSAFAQTEGGVGGFDSAIDGGPAPGVTPNPDPDAGSNSEQSNPCPNGVSNACEPGQHGISWLCNCSNPCGCFKEQF